jgi:hypothetical protein
MCWYCAIWSVSLVLFINNWNFFWSTTEPTEAGHLFGGLPLVGHLSTDPKCEPTKSKVRRRQIPIYDRHKNKIHFGQNYILNNNLGWRQLSKCNLLLFFRLRKLKRKNCHCSKIHFFLVDFKVVFKPGSGYSQKLLSGDYENDCFSYKINKNRKLAYSTG